MTKILNFGFKIKGHGREGGTWEVLRPCHPPKNLKRALDGATEHTHRFLNAALGIYCERQQETWEK